MPSLLGTSGAKPRCQQLAEHLRQQINSGALQPNERLPAHGDLRALYGVAQPTVERAHRILKPETSP